MSDTEIKRLRRIEKLAKRALKPKLNAVEYLRVLELSKTHARCIGTVYISNAVMRDLIRELME